MRPAALLPLGFLVALGLAVTLAATSGPTLAAEPEIEIHDDVEFGTGGGFSLRMDIARPAGAKGRLPCVLVFHGGGWVQGDKSQFRPLVRFLAEDGFVAATVQYRLARPGMRNGNAWPAQIEDAKCAVRYMRAHAERWGVDPDRIAAMGFSAGAHLSMLLGTMEAADGLEGDGGWSDQSSKVNAVVGFYGPTCMGCIPPEDKLSIAKMPVEEKQRVIRGLALGAVLGPVFGQDPTRASPLTYVNEGDAPMLLFQGTNDKLVEPFHTELMMEALTAAHVPGRAVFMLGLGHGWRDDPHLTSNVRDTQRFLDEIFRPGRVQSILPRLRLGR
ncbi:MAG: alpha/beta hydrolase [Planctomycetota bacterium]|nr:alpha/beta hydrolase [Planctomycetota bacterium]